MSSTVKTIWNKYCQHFGTSIIHPQFVVRRFQYEAVIEAKKYAKGDLVDIGCGRMPYREELEPLVKSYTGVDHPKIAEKYRSDKKPEVLADAKKLPFKGDTFDMALLLQVLEHVDYPQAVINEAARILKPGGILIISCPFLYPLHDLPHDRGRYTDISIRDFLRQASLKVVSLKVQGNFLEFWLQSLNVFVIKRVDDIIASGIKPSTIAVLFFYLIIAIPSIICSNITMAVANKLSSFFPKYPNYFPLDYLIVARKERL